jgi:hypothetical protein
MGVVIGRSSFGFAGPAQRLADQDSAGSLRIRGKDLFSIAFQASSGAYSIMPDSTIGPYWAAISPSTISPRLAAIESMFQWYVIRRLKIMYVPTTGSTTVGSVGIGISTDWDTQDALPTPTQTQILELQPAILTPVWTIASVEMKNTGTKLYECYLSSESGQNRFQAILGAALNTGALSGAIGQLFMEYEVDFYQPTPIVSAIDREARTRRHVPFAPALARAVHRTESKEEVKLPPPIQTTESGWDSADPSPPSSRATAPSSYPGAPAYVPSVGSLVPPPIRIPSRK